MRALVFSRFGGPEVLSIMELAKPAPTEDEVVVRVAAATVNPTDLLMRSGQQAAMMLGLTPPYIAGMEFSGTVDAVGSGVATLILGQRVMGVVNPRTPGGGAHAEYVRVPASSVAPLETSIEFAHAATVPMNGLTCLAALHALDLNPGQTLLVTGGAGVLASFAIQLAKARGLTVVADSSETDKEHLHSLHVDETVPRGAAMDAAVRSRFPAGVDGLLDTALLGGRAGALVRDGGTTVSLRKSHLITDPRLRNSYVSVIEQMHNNAALRHLGTLLSSGALATRVACRMPLSKGEEANRLAEQAGLRGRVVLECLP